MTAATIARRSMTHVPLALLLLAAAAAAQVGSPVPPVRVAVVFDNSGSMAQVLPQAHSIVKNLMQELYYLLPGAPDDKVVFIALNDRPEVVRAVEGRDLRSQAEREFLQAFDRPVTGRGTDVVGALELAGHELGRRPQPCWPILLVFSDLHADPAPEQAFRALADFEWDRLRETVSFAFFVDPEAARRLETEAPEFARNVRYFTWADLGGRDGDVPGRLLDHRLRRIEEELGAALMALLSEHQARQVRQTAGRPGSGGGLLLAGVLVAALLGLAALAFRRPAPARAAAGRSHHG